MDFSSIHRFNQLQEMREGDVEIYHYFDAEPGGVTLHAHDFYELYCILDGKMNYYAAGHSFALEPGALLLIAPGEMHRPVTEGPPRAYERIVLWMKPGFVSSLRGLFPRELQAFDGKYRGSPLIAPDGETYPVLLSLLKALLYENERTEAFDSPLLRRLIAAELLVRLSRILRQRPDRPVRVDARYADMIKVYEYINSNYQQKIDVNHLSDHFFMDRNTLTRQFRRIIGLTPGEYLRRRRLQEAYDLIQRGYGVLDAGYKCGFGDYSAFYRAFRQAYGIAPSQLAKHTEGRNEGGGGGKDE